MPNYSLIALCLACVFLTIEVLSLKRKTRILSRQLRSVRSRTSCSSRALLPQANPQRVSFVVKEAVKDSLRQPQKK